MKSKFFVLVAVVALGLALGITTTAYCRSAGDASITESFVDLSSSTTTSHTSSDFHFSGDLPVPCFGPTCPGWRPPMPDTDGDGTVDLADNDDDGDGVLDVDDNCPIVVNADQADVDGDDIGDVCDSDNDNDGVINDADDCAGSSPDFDVDPNGCTVDSDSDGKTDDIDACPDVAADTDDGCALSSMIPIIGGVIHDTAIEDDPADPQDTDTNAAEGFSSGGCSLAQNPSASNALSALVLAISLLPIGIRRKIK